MDRFKFRAWDKEYDSMVYDIERAAENDIGDSFWHFLFFSDQYHIMQCTGLKDKNGKLIYEGDIVSAGAEHATIVWHKFAFQALQGWEQEGRIYQTLLQLKDDMILEVIGNIYENPDLLKE